MVALNNLTGPTYHPTKPLSSKYIVKPIDERVQQMDDYLLRLRVQKEIACGCDSILVMTCPACDEAMECQAAAASELQLIARDVYFNHWTGISIHRNGTTRNYGKGRKWEKTLKAICQRDRIRASFFPGGTAYDI